MALGLLFFVLCLHSLDAACPNFCNRNGKCTDENLCQCADGYGGADCSEGNLLPLLFPSRPVSPHLVIVSDQ
jgi:hypothetical protein